MTSSERGGPEGGHRWKKSWPKDKVDSRLDFYFDFVGLALILLAVIFILAWPSRISGAGAMVTAAGLLGVGHGIRRHGKSDAN
jgi:hypothetical protein